MRIWTHSLVPSPTTCIPLTPQVGFAQLLLEDPGTLSRVEVREYLRMVVRSSRKMSNIIQERRLEICWAASGEG